MAITKKDKAEVAKTEGKVTMIAAAQPPAMASNALAVEDEFNPFYLTGTNSTTGHVLKPPYDPKVLERLTQESNILGACIDAMIVNVAGTGHKIEAEVKKAEDADEKDDETAKKLEAFFREPFPGISFVTMRRELERDMERIGYGALEVMRNPAGEVVFLRNTPGRTFRLCKLDAPVKVKKTVTRNGVEVSYDVMVRERRFVQLVAGQLLFFKEFGASRDLNKKTGQWATPHQPVAPKDRATELLYFQVGQDPNSPYGVPRWEGQIPSIVGSRVAEETNLVYLQSGGLPPALIIVQGGSMAGDARQALERQFAPGQKARAAILELASTDGTLDKPGSVKVSVERFGHERAGDAMWENYDSKCAERVLRSFRFSPLFVGKSGDFNFATAYASYLAAESQVFGPERKHFDEIITRKLLPALGGSGYVFVSNPIQIKDVTQQIAALSLAASLAGADPESLIDQLNKAADLEIQFSQEQIDKADEMARQEMELRANQPAIGLDGKPVPGGGPKPFGVAKPGQKPAQGVKPAPGQKPGQPGAKPVPKGKPGEAKPAGKEAGKPKLTVVKNDVQSIAHPSDLADRALVAMRLMKLDDLAEVMAEVDTRPLEDQVAFRRYMASRHFVNAATDPEGLGDIASYTAELLQA